MSIDVSSKELDDIIQGAVGTSPAALAHPATVRQMMHSLPQSSVITEANAMRWAAHLSTIPEVASSIVSAMRGLTAEEAASICMDEGLVTKSPGWIGRLKLCEILPWKKSDEEVQADLLSPLAYVVLNRAKDLHVEHTTNQSAAAVRPADPHSWLIEVPITYVVKEGQRWAVDFRNVEGTPSTVISRHDAYRAAYLVAASNARGIDVAGVISAEYSVYGQSAVVEWADDPVLLKAFAEKVVSPRRDGSRRLEMERREISADSLRGTISELIVTCGAVWGGVLKGFAPGERERRELSTQDQAEAARLSGEYVAFRALEKASKEKADEAQKVLSGLLSRGARAGAGLTVRKYAQVSDEVERVLRAKGFSPAEYMRQVPDVPKMMARLVFLGEDVSTFKRFEGMDQDRAISLLTREERDRLVVEKVSPMIRHTDPMGRVIPVQGELASLAKEAVGEWFDSSKSVRRDDVVSRLKAAVAFGFASYRADAAIDGLLKEFSKQKNKAALVEAIRQFADNATDEQIDRIDAALSAVSVPRMRMSPGGRSRGVRGAAKARQGVEDSEPPRP